MTCKDRGMELEVYRRFKELMEDPDPDLCEWFEAAREVAQFFVDREFDSLLADLDADTAATFASLEDL